MSNQPPEPKYRPVLTASQIQYIVSICKSQVPITTADISIVATLSPFLAKIENLGIQAAYTPQPEKVSPYSLEGLGGMTRATGDSSKVAKEVRWQAAYSKYSTDPTACSAVELTDAREHMYLNSLMSKEEEIAFEAETGEVSTNG